MKKILLFLLFVGVAFAQAQVSYGVKVGATLGEISNSLYKQQIHPSLFFSVFADVPLASKLSIQPGVSIIGKGSDFVDEFDGAKLDHIYSVMTIEVPVNAVYSIQTGKTGNFLVGVGPYIGFNVKGKDNYVGNINNERIDVSNTLKTSGEEKDLNLIDAGGNFMVGYRFTNKLLLSVNYNLGLTDIDPIKSKTQSFRTWSFGVGFHF